MSVCFSQASGIIIIMACGSDLPDCTRSSRTSSNDAESLPPGVTIGFSRSISVRSSELSLASLARIQFLLPFTVLISPLCAIILNGCANGQEGKVFVEKRE